MPEPYADAVIRFAGGIEVDTRSAPGLESGELPPGPLLVRLAGPVRRGWLDSLAAAGLEPLAGLAHQNLICRPRPGTAAEAVRGLGFVTWLDPLPAAARLSAGLLAATGETEACLALWPGCDPGPVARAIAAAGGRIGRIGSGTVTFRADAAVGRGLAGRPDVAFVQPVDPATDFNNDVQWVIQSGWHSDEPLPDAGRPVWRHGLRGQGMLVGLFDSGIRTDHDMFADPLEPITGPGIFPTHRKLAAYKLYPGAWFGDRSGFSYHGSGVAGTLAGNDSITGDSVKLEGMAPDARIYFLDVGSDRYEIDPNYTQMLDSVRLARGMSEPVRQVSGAFGSTAEAGAYRIEEASTDAVAWRDPGFLVIWAAGNSGSGPRNIGHPACAKNVLTVGASGNGTASNLVASFSSRGPTLDGRIKPELLAPGLAVRTVGGWTTHDYIFRNGTSFAAPAVSGALVLVRQYLKEGWFPAGAPDSARAVTDPSAALMRALAVAAVDSNVGTLAVPNVDVGWGRLDIGSLLHFAGDTLAFTFVEERSGVSTGWFLEYELDVATRAPLRAVLAWTDTAAPAGAGIALVNDLNLELVSPEGNRFRGNQYLEGQSRPNPSAWDELNNLEVCQLDRPVTGRWLVRIYGRNVHTATQPFGLVVKAGLAGSPVIAGSDRPQPPVRAGHRVIRRAALAALAAALEPGATIDLFSVDGRRVARLPGPLPRLGAGSYHCRTTGPGPATDRFSILLLD